MKTAEHTAGPWEIVNTNAGWQIRMPHPRSPTRMHYGAVVYEEANAALIRSAPEMLEALRYYAAIKGPVGEPARSAIAAALHPGTSSNLYSAGRIAIPKDEAA